MNRRVERNFLSTDLKDELLLFVFRVPNNQTFLALKANNFSLIDPNDFLIFWWNFPEELVLSAKKVGAKNNVATFYSANIEVKIGIRISVNTKVEFLEQLTTHLYWS